MTLREIADHLDTIAVDMANALMPTVDDPDRAAKAYVLGIASAAVKREANTLRAMDPDGIVKFIFEIKNG